jgi:VWFA-related protein
MRSRRPLLSLLFFSLILCWLGQSLAQAPGSGQQAADQAPATAPGVIRTEVNLVLVDVVATDKKGNYIPDLQANEFRVFEDDKEQPITTFSRVTEAEAAQSPAQPRYVVLFFDNSTMAPPEQARARAAAAQFVEKSASTNRLMAVVDFSGAFRITQNFTASADMLKRAVGGIKFASVQPNEPGQTTQIASLGTPSMLQVRSDFAARTVLLAIRNVAKTLRDVPGRKTLILFSGGFPLTPERESELTATIDAANKANVAIYPIDVRGLQGVSPSTMPDMMEPGRESPFQGMPPGAQLDESPFPHQTGLWALQRGGLMLPTRLAQRPTPGGGGTGSGGTGVGGGGTGGGRTGGGGTPSTGGGTSGSTTGGGRTPGGTTPGTSTGTTSGGARGGGGGRPQPGDYGYGRQGYETYPRRDIIPPLLDSLSSNQQVLHALAAGTGGFTIFNTNDFLEGLNRIAKELGEYYVLGYAPPSQAHDGSYHKINVKVERKGVKIRFRNGYYDVKGPDILAGRPEGKTLEEQAVSPQPGDIPVSLNTPYFYTGPNVARVNLAMEVPAQSLTFEKDKGKFHSAVNVLGIAYREDGSVAARFSDAVKLDMEKGDLKEFSKGSFFYQNTFNIAPGKYKLRVVLGAGGQKFGKYEKTLHIEPFDGKHFHMSGVALSSRMQPVSELAANLDAALLEERTPLVVKGVELVPSPNSRFKRDAKLGFYVEVYEPLLLTNDQVRVGIIFDVIDPKTNQRVFTSNTVPLNAYIEAGNPVIPVGAYVPVDKLQAGQYRLDVKALDGAGNTSPMHSVEFNLE